MPEWNAGHAASLREALKMLGAFSNKRAVALTQGQAACGNVAAGPMRVEGMVRVGRLLMTFRLFFILEELAGVMHNILLDTMALPERE